MDRRQGWWACGFLAAGLVLGRWQTPSPPVLAQGLSTRGGELIVTSLPIDGGQALVLVDPKQEVLCIYEVDKKALRLKAARHFTHDLKLAEYNNDRPFVADIEKLLKR